MPHETTGTTDSEISKVVPIIILERQVLQGFLYNLWLGLPLLGDDEREDIFEPQSADQVDQEEDKTDAEDGPADDGDQGVRSELPAGVERAAQHALRAGHAHGIRH